MKILLYRTLKKKRNSQKHLLKKKLLRIFKIVKQRICKFQLFIEINFKLQFSNNCFVTVICNSYKIVEKKIRNKLIYF